MALYSDTPSHFVPLHRAWRFFDAAARRWDPELGWRVGKYVGDKGLGRGLLSRLEHEPSLCQALETFVRLANSEASHVRLEMFERPDDIVLSSCYPVMRGVSGYSASQSYQLGLMIALVREFLGESWIPAEVGIEAPRVPRVAHEVSGCSRVLPGQRTGYIVIQRCCLTASCGFIAVKDDGTEPIVKTSSLDFAETLELLLEPYLPGGYVSADLAASLMNVSVRTLGRRLSQLDVTYRDLIDRARFRVARRLLRDGDMRITDVAIGVGFDDSSNFARMFRRIAGLPPREFRRHALAGA
jgi:AraC-like DNA-binding protein